MVFVHQFPSLDWLCRSFLVWMNFLRTKWMLGFAAWHKRRRGFMRLWKVWRQLWKPKVSCEALSAVQFLVQHETLKLFFCCHFHFLQQDPGEKASTKVFGKKGKIWTWLKVWLPFNHFVSSAFTPSSQVTRAALVTHCLRAKAWLQEKKI